MARWFFNGIFFTPMNYTKIPGNGVYESFQQYSNDPYLGNLSHKTGVSPAYDTSPAREGITLKDVFSKRLVSINKFLVENEV